MQHYATDKALDKAEIKEISLTSAIDEAVLATADALGRKGVDFVLAKARAATLPDKRMRATILNRAARRLVQDRHRFARAISMDTAKPMRLAEAEVDFAAEALRESARIILQLRGRELPMQRSEDSQHHFGVTTHYPHGVALAYSAYTQPLANAVMQIAPMFAAGNAVVFKPADHSVLVPLMLLELMREVELPEDNVQIAIVWDPDVAEYLATHKRVNFFNFMGSMKVGLKLNSMIAGRTVMQFGGITSALVTDELTPEAALKIAHCAFDFSGQSANSVQHIYVPQKNAKKVAKQLTDAVSKLIVGDPLSLKTDLGPMIALGEAIRIERAVKETVDAGAKLYCGGKRNEKTYPPTIIYNPPADSVLVTKEVMGPVLSIIPVEDVASAVHHIHREHSARVSIFGDHINILGIAEALHVPNIFINEVPSFHKPWLGVGSRTLLGVEDAILRASLEKSLVIKLAV